MAGLYRKPAWPGGELRSAIVSVVFCAVVVTEPVRLVEYVAATPGVNVPKLGDALGSDSDSCPATVAAAVPVTLLVRGSSQIPRPKVAANSSLPSPLSDMSKIGAFGTPVLRFTHSDWLPSELDVSLWM